MSPYVKEKVKAGSKPLHYDAPGGSSGGSAVSVASGLSVFSLSEFILSSRFSSAPLAIGTEVFGSMCQPGIRAGLYAMKGPLNSVDLTGIQGGQAYHCLGGFAKTPQDLAALMDVMSDKPLHLEANRQAPLQLGSLSIGCIDFDDWRPPSGLMDLDGAMEAEHVSCSCPPSYKLNIFRWV